MTQKATYAERLTDIRRVIAQFNRLPENARSYVVGYVEGRAEGQTEWNLQMRQTAQERVGA